MNGTEELRRDAGKMKKENEELNKREELKN